MADYFTTASQQNDQAKAGLLQAIREQGSQAKQAFDQQQAAVAQQKQQAIAAALSGAAQRGAPAAMQQEVQSTIAAPYDERTASMGQAAATRQAQIGAIGANADAYMTKANAALPALRTRVAEGTAAKQAQLAQQIAAAQAAAQAKAIAAQQAAEEHQARMQQIQLEMQLAQTRAAASQAKTAKVDKQPGASQILNDQFGGRQGFLDYLAGVIPQAQGAAHEDYTSTLGQLRSLGAGGNRVARGEANLMTESIPTDTDVAERVGGMVGLTPGLASGMLSAYQQQEQRQASSIRDDPGYAQAVQSLINGVNKGATRGQIADQLSQHYGPDIARQVLADYSRVLPNQPGHPNQPGQQ